MFPFDDVIMYKGMQFLSSKYDLCSTFLYLYYCQTFNISCTLIGNKIVDHSDVVGAPPVGAAPTTSSLST